jgi:hypothetical protein
MSASLLKRLDAAYSEWPLDVKLVQEAATRIRVLEKGVRDALDHLSALRDEQAIDALQMAMRDTHE